MPLTVLYLVFGWIFIVVPSEINNRTESQTIEQVNLKVAEIKKVRSRIESSDPAQIESFMKSSGVTNVSPLAFKSKLIRDNKNSQKQFEEQSQVAKDTQTLFVIKNAVKWEFGTIISSILFFRIWLSTDWIRGL